MRENAKVHHPAVNNICDYWHELMDLGLGKDVHRRMNKILDEGDVIRSQIGEENWNALEATIEHLVKRALRLGTLKE